MPRAKLTPADLPRALELVEDWGVMNAAFRFRVKPQELRAFLAAHAAPDPEPAPDPAPAPLPTTGYQPMTERRRAPAPRPAPPEPAPVRAAPPLPRAPHVPRYTRAEERLVLDTITKHGPLGFGRLTCYCTGTGQATLKAVLAALTTHGQIKFSDGRYYHTTPAPARPGARA